MAIRVQGVLKISLLSGHFRCLKWNPWPVFHLVNPRFPPFFPRKQIYNKQMLCRIHQNNKQPKLFTSFHQPFLGGSYKGRLFVASQCRFLKRPTSLYHPSFHQRRLSEIPISTAKKLSVYLSVVRLGDLAVMSPWIAFPYGFFLSAISLSLSLCLSLDSSLVAYVR